MGKPFVPQPERESLGYVSWGDAAIILLAAIAFGNIVGGLIALLLRAAL